MLVEAVRNSNLNVGGNVLERNGTWSIVRGVGLVESAATARGLRVRRLPSGAGHDAQMLARVCPTSMIFVPSHKGISHNPAEHTDTEQLVAGCDVLLHALLTLTESEVGR